MAESGPVLLAAKPQQSSPQQPPAARDLDSSDDWTSVTDRKEKKKIQNRVAQRSYRQRMKARLGDLQARLDYHEGRTNQLPASDTADGGVTDSNGTVSSEALQGDTLAHAATRPMTSPAPSHESPDALFQLLQSRPGGHPLESTGMNDVSFTHLMQQSLTSDSPSLNHPLMPRMQTPTAADAGGQQNVSREFLLDCLQFQAKLLEKLSNRQETAEQTGHTGHAADENRMSVDLSSLSNFTHPDPVALETAAWKLLNPSEEVGHLSLASDTGSITSNGGYFDLQADIAMTKSMASDTGSPPTPPAKDATLEERLGYVMESAEMAGYHDFNALISAYYTSDFPESSSLSNEQRLSRNRRLPKVLFELFQATSSWSEWERRGFQEEILKTAENMLSLEGDSARRGLEIKLTPLLNALDDENNVGAKRQSIHAMKLLIQNEIPNLWALAMALTSSSSTPRQQDRSNTALATILLLFYSESIPVEKLIKVVDSCT